jgi:alkanesulfonate monooxygenase SsuD/methylene tetrahydromethanopterin reductase-like flavin-dependent oxidoreductase (luciferase family)
MTRVPLSILELAPVSAGSTGAQALRDSVTLAERADTLGYTRFWFAEHHLSAGVASAAPAVLTALVAARTEHLRVGTGAVLLSTTSPLIAVEQLATVAALHPGRIDLGVGRALTPTPTPSGDAPAAAPPAQRPPSSARVVDGLLVPANPPIDFSDSSLRERLLGQKRVISANRVPAAFRDELEVVLGLKDGTYTDTDDYTYGSAPVEGSDAELWVLASSGGESAVEAGRLGLPLVANYHVSPATILETVASYREAFVPGVLAAAYVAVSADVLVAETDAEAERIGAPFAEWVLSIRAGLSGAVEYPTPEDAAAREWTKRELEIVLDRTSTRFVGSPERVVAGLETLQRATGADEILTTTIAHDPADKLRSVELLARAWGLRTPSAEAAISTAGHAPIPAVEDAYGIAAPRLVSTGAHS